MMKVFTGILLLQIFSIVVFSQRVSGVVTDKDGNPLPNASILIKGKSGGTVCNSEGKYFLKLSPGSYTLIAQYVGYKRDTRNIVLSGSDITLDFSISPVDFSLEEVIVRSGENPANDIIRNTIRMRKHYQHQLDNFICEVYSKGQLRLRDYPTKVRGQKLVFKDGDTSKHKIVYLSETVSKYSVQQPKNTKIEVFSSKVSGNSESYGLAAPRFYSLYDNNVRIGENLNPRGFISPISDNATNYYKYKYMGSFFEEGKQVNRIKVTPKRKYEPLFTGFINIVEDDWRLHSVNLELLKSSQMEYLDTLRLEQIYSPFSDSLWVIHSQVIYPSIKILGIDAYGSFINVYSKFDPNPDFGKNYFDNTVLKYSDSAIRKAESYWDEARPVKLMDAEILDYRKKDSMERASKNPAFLDSVDRIKNKLSFTGIVLFGQTFTREKKRSSVFIPPLRNQVSFNIVEGLVLNTAITYTKKLDSIVGRKEIKITPTLRFGFNNQHFTAWLNATYTYGKKYVSAFNIAGGKRVYQFNNLSPITAFSNTTSSLLSRRNTLKLYEAWFFQPSFTKGIGDGFTWGAGVEYQNRTPLENTTNYSWTNKAGKEYTPNYPTEISNENIKKHQAFSFNAAITWQPNAKYIEMPDRKINIGSKWPKMTLGYTQAVKNLFGSDVDYSKWRFSLTDIISFKLVGLFNYRVGIGGFLGTKHVEIPDYQHFNGNISRIASAYLNSFQILPIYEFSNTSKFYSLLHIEHHFNGFLTNKIPGFRNLNWYLVSGFNTFYYEKTNYREFFVGLENILKRIRIDYYWSMKDGKKYDSNVRLGVTPGFLRR